MSAPARPAGSHDAAVAARDPALPGLAVLLDADEFATELAAACPSADVRGARAGYVRYKPGDSVLVAYELDTGAGTLSAYARAQRPDDHAKLAKVRRRARTPSELGPGGLLIPELGIAVYLFPNDRRIKALPRLAEPAARRELLQRMLPGHPELHGAALEPLRYKPERRFVAAIEGDGGERAVLKAYATGWHRASAAAKGISSGGALRVPKRLGRSRRRHVVALEWLPGRALSELAAAPGQPPDGLAGAARRTGEAVAELHRRRPRHLREPDTTDGQRLRAAAEAAAGCCPELAGRLERLSERLAPTLAPAGGAAIHGDLAPDQVIVGEGGQVAIVDLDQAAIGDPAADLAGFAAAAEHDVVAGRLDPERRDALLDGFAAGYESACGQPGRAPAPRVAASLVRLAPEPFRRRDPAWPALTRALVERAEELAHG